MAKTYQSKSDLETIEIGKEFAEVLKIGDIVGFDGDLGAGKTEFIKGICKHLKVKDIVTSPTFSIVNNYLGSFTGKKIDVTHIDLYRINDPDELNEIGFDELIYNTDSLKFVEWYKNAGNRLPKLDYIVNIILSAEDMFHRQIVITKIDKPKDLQGQNYN
jgi:tRNA threonylcarbamoyladenosine biosynthesis protein TsaE